MWVLWGAQFVNGLFRGMQNLGEFRTEREAERAGLARFGTRSDDWNLTFEPDEEAE